MAPLTHTNLTALLVALLLSQRATEIQGWVPSVVDGSVAASRFHWDVADDITRRASWTRRRINKTKRMGAKLPGVNSENVPSPSVSLSTASIRECLYGDLGQCADVIMSAFYPNYNSPWKHLTRLAELDRIQQTFSYDKKEHMMFVAIIADEIVGFVDIDLRPPNRPMPYTYNPRPYLSDLCVHADYQRRGIARDLIARCEQFCVTNDKKEVYIRVQSNNIAAVHLYKYMGYTVIDNPDCSDGSILILMKRLTERSELHAADAKTEVDSRQDDSEDYSI